jgi:hypothetical protein
VLLRRSLNKIADVFFYIPWRGAGVANLQQGRQNRNGKWQSGLF